MPENTIATTTTTTTHAATDVKLVEGKLVRKMGKAILTLDVSKLHAYLEMLGVGKDAASKRFADAPASRAEIIDTTQHAFVPKALCSTDYVKDKPGILEFDIIKQYTVPPTEKTLNDVAETVRDAAIAVIAHYQPVEISISVVGKKPR